MQAQYERIQQYLNMDEEISFKEFQNFYKEVINELSKAHQGMDEATLWKALFVVENIISNADGRAKETKGAEVKKYSKMSQRLQLYAKNFGVRLGEAGYTEEDINERFQQMFAEGEEAAKLS
ncbi:hypothetical protein [Shouchella clausii]|uniref:hypothetical protein n=1 Tax=Shouchella clausii TaxID=79880 RepID=UPI0026FA51CE|nr:hypothetical protein [Shouchella clausii]MDO7267436.1 hypothetical protein [Shouchella clausii]MDO7287610.1 hypothetical protein [Shouchella clausii]